MILYCIIRQSQQQKNEDSKAQLPGRYDNQEETAFIEARKGGIFSKN